MLDALLFDLDGTLIDSHMSLSAAANTLRQQRGLPPVPAESLRASSLISTPALLKAAFSLTPDDPEYASIQSAYLQIYCHSIHQNALFLFPGVEALLTHLNTNNIPWGIVTNKMREPTQRYLTPDSPLSQGIQTLVCYDDTPNPKPAPDPILKALEELGSPAHCWYVGDQPIDVLAAHAAGIRVIAANWTHSPSTRPEWHRYQPDHTCDSIEALISFIHAEHQGDPLSSS